MPGLLAILNFHLSFESTKDGQPTIPYAPVAAHDTRSDIALNFSKRLTQSVSYNWTGLLVECILIFTPLFLPGDLFVVGEPIVNSGVSVFNRSEGVGGFMHRTVVVDCPGSVITANGRLN